MPHKQTAVKLGLCFLEIFLLTLELCNLLLKLLILFLFNLLLLLHQDRHHLKLVQLVVLQVRLSEDCRPLRKLRIVVECYKDYFVQSISDGDERLMILPFSLSYGGCPQVDHLLRGRITCASLNVNDLLCFFL